MVPLAFLAALALAAAFTPVMIRLGRRFGWLVQPREDRWHQKPTAVYGGVAMFAAFAAVLLILGPRGGLAWTILGCGGALFLLGLIDDALELSPQLKFLVQLLVAIAAVTLGVRLTVIPWPWLAVPLSVFWLVGVTNAVNILDNMDGLSSGVACVAGIVLALSAWLGGSPATATLGAALAGCAAGFLIYNFNPAKIFMGDCGSLFLGFTLAALAILETQDAGGASHLVLALLIPLGALVVPIFDTTLVSFQRTSHGRSIAQGGRDHSSHRLVFLGLSERRAVSVLLLISLAGGVVSLALVHYTTPLVALVVAAVLVVLLIFFGIYLGDVEVYDKDSERYQGTIIGGVMMHKKQMLQIAVDLVLLSAAYTAAYLLRFEGDIPKGDLGALAGTLPLLLAVKLVVFWLFGLYRGQWRYVSVHDMVQIGKASAISSLVFVLILVVVYRFQGFSRAVMIIDTFLAFMFVAGSRSLIRVFRESLRGKKGVPVIIMGAGDGGEMLLREIRNNPQHGYQPVGFLDDDPAKKGVRIHGVPVLGARKDAARYIAEYQAGRVFIAILSAKKDDFPDLFETCQEQGIPCTFIQPIIKI